MASLKIVLLIIAMWTSGADRASIAAWGAAPHRPADCNTLSEYYREVKSLSGFPSLTGSGHLISQQVNQNGGISFAVELPPQEHSLGQGTQTCYQLGARPNQGHQTIRLYEHYTIGYFDSSSNWGFAYMAV